MRRRVGNLDHAFRETNQEFESQRFHLHQASQQADQAQRQKISLYGGLELRNRLFQENHGKVNQEIEERICCEEIEQTRQARSEELSVQQRRNPTTVSQMMARIQDLQNKVNTMTDAREFSDLESRSSSGAIHVLDQTSAILSSRTLPRCDSGLPRNTQNCTCIVGNVFERPLAQEGQTSTIFNNSKNLASSSHDMRPDISETARTRYGKGIIEHANSITSLPMQKWNVESYWWNLFSRWYGGLSENSFYGIASRKIS